MEISRRQKVPELWRGLGWQTDLENRGIWVLKTITGVNRTQEESAGDSGPEAALGLRSFEKDLLRI